LPELHDEPTAFCRATGRMLSISEQKGRLLSGFRLTGFIKTKKSTLLLLDLFNNPVGYFTSLGKMLRILLFFSGICSETEVSEQLYCMRY
jgi:hypothetical protein